MAVVPEDSWKVAPPRWPRRTCHGGNGRGRGAREDRLAAASQEEVAFVSRRPHSRPRSRNLTTRGYRAIFNLGVFTPSPQSTGAAQLPCDPVRAPDPWERTEEKAGPSRTGGRAHGAAGLCRGCWAARPCWARLPVCSHRPCLSPAGAQTTSPVAENTPSFSYVL